MRNLKKFLAVIMTVAMIASLMVPALAAGSNEDEAEALKTIGLFKGTSDTDLALERPLTRDQGVTLVVRILGKEDEALALSEEEISAELAKMADAAAIPGWARPYVAFALKEKIANGVGHDGVTSFDSAAPMTGKHFTTFVLRALGYADVDYNNPWDTAVDAGVLTAGQTITLAKDSIIRDDAVAAIYGAVKNGVLADGKTKLLDKLIADGAVDEDAAREAGFITEPEKLEVEDVEALNLLQIKVEFNSTKFDKDEAGDVDNYNFEGVKEGDKKDDTSDIEVAKASVDENVVILTLEEPVENDSEGSLEINKNVGGEKFVVEEIEFRDTKLPEVENAEVIGIDTVKVTFSEPIDFRATGETAAKVSGTADSDFEDEFEVKMGTKTYRIDEVIVASNATEAKVTVYGDFTDGTLDLTVNNGLEDFAGYSIRSKTFELDVVKDEEAPTIVDYKDAKVGGVTLIFNEDIKFEDDDEENFYHTNSKNPVDKTPTIDGKELKLTWDEDSELPEGTVYIHVDGESLSDYWDNVQKEDLVFAIEVEKDDTAPEVTDVTAKAADSIKVVFSEEVDKDDAEDEGNYTLEDANGDEIDIDDADLYYDSDEEEWYVLLVPDDDLDDGAEYTLTVKGIEDLAGNKIEEYTGTFSLDDDNAPFVKLEDANNDGDGDSVLLIPDKDNDDTTDETKKEYTIVIKFNEAMSTEGTRSVLNLENYDLTVNGHVLNLGEVDEETDDDAYEGILPVTDIDDIKIDIDVTNNDKTVEINLKGFGTIAAGDSNYAITIGRVADASGIYNKLATQVYGPYPFVETSGIDSVTVDKVTTTAKDALKVEVSADLDVVDPDDFSIVSDQGAVTGLIDKLDDEDDGNDTFAILLEHDLNTDGSVTIGAITYTGLKLKVTNPQSETVYGIKLEAAEDPIYEKIAPEIAEITDAAVGLDDDDDISAEAGKIAIKFTEEIDDSSVSGLDFSVDGHEINTAVVSTTDPSIVVLTLADSEAPAAVRTDVTIEGTIFDTNGNKYDGDTALNVEYQVSGLVPAGAISADDDNITDLVAGQTYQIDVDGDDDYDLTKTADGSGVITKTSHGQDWDANDTVIIKLKATDIKYTGAQTITVGA